MMPTFLELTEQTSSNRGSGGPVLVNVEMIQMVTGDPAGTVLLVQERSRLLVSEPYSEVVRRLALTSRVLADRPQDTHDAG